MSESKKNTVIKAGLTYTIVNFLSKGAVFLTTPIFTRLMLPNDVGAFANITAWFQIMVALVTFDMFVTLSVARFDYENELDKYISSTLIYGSVVTGIVYVVVICNMDFFCELFSMEKYAIHIIFIYMLVYPALQMLQQKNLFEFKYFFSAFITLLSLLVSVGFALLLTIKLDDKLLGRTLGYYVPLIVINGLIYIYFLVKARGISLKYFKYAVAISFPMLWHSMATQVLSAGDRVIITQYAGERANAMYSIAYTCSMVVSVLWSSMNSAWAPWAIEKMHLNEKNDIKKASRPYIVLFASIVVFIILISPELLLIMGGAEYMEAIGCLPPIMVGLICQFIYSLYINAEYYLKKNTRIAIGTIIAATVNIILNIIFIPIFGYIAAAYTTLFGYILLLFFHYYSLKLLGYGGLYDDGFNWKVVGGFVLALLVILLIYKFRIVRYSLIGLYIVGGCSLCYSNREEIRSFLAGLMKRKHK